jgi:ADP-dependent NAD(P)H-hydrate dehydratase / NAD(P)H-hydrate epimerase
MQQYPYWQVQTSEKPLFPDVEWNRPEQRTLRGRLGIIGGNKLGFAGVAEAYSTAYSAGAGEVKVLLPDILRKTIPAAITEAIFAPNNISGSLSKEALEDMQALGAWSTGILLAGDTGKSSETTVVYDDFIGSYGDWITLTRDAVDLVRRSAPVLVERPHTLYVISFAQLQKLFQDVYYPKILTFSMQLAQLVENVHKFTLSYPVTIMTLHQGHVVIAHEGQVVTQKWENPMAIWRGHTAARAASYLLWHSKPLEALASSVKT